MAIRVDVPNIGMVEFPDGMSNDQISEAINRDILKTDAPMKTNTKISPAESFARGAADAGTLGFADEIGAGIAAPFVKYARPDLFGDKSLTDVYKGTRDIAREQQKASYEQNPISSVLGGVGGSIALPFPARGAMDAAKLGAGYGAAYGVGSSEEENVPGMALDALKGGALGAPLGAAGYKIAEGVQNLGRGLLNKINPPKQNPMFESVEAPPSPLTEQQQYAMDLSSKNEVPLTFAQTSRSPLAQADEDLILAGKYGTDNAMQAKSFQDTQNQQYQTALSKLRNELGGGQYTENYEAVAPAIKKIQDTALSQKQNIRSAYDDALSNNTSLASKNLDPFISQATKELNQQGIYPVNSSKVFNELSAFNNIVKNGKSVPYKAPVDPYAKERQRIQENLNMMDQVKGMWGTVKSQERTEALNKIKNLKNRMNELPPIPSLGSKAPKNVNVVNFKELEAWRQGLNNTLQGADGRDIVGLNTIKKSFDNYLDNAVETALKYGDSGTLEKFKQARLLNKEWMDKYTAKDTNEYGKKFIEDIVSNANSREPYTNQMIVNKLFGSGELGFSPQSANVVKEIKGQLGANSAEFKGLKMEAANRILKPLFNNRGEFNVRNPSIETYKKNLEKNATVLKEVFSADEIQKLKEFGDLGSMIYQMERSKFNPSQTGILELISKNLKNIPLVNNVINILEQAKNIKMGNKAIGLSQADLIRKLEKLNKSNPNTPLNIFNEALKQKNMPVSSSVSKALSIVGPSTLERNKERR